MYHYTLFMILPDLYQLLSWQGSLSLRNDMQLSDMRKPSSGITDGTTSGKFSPTTYYTPALPEPPWG